MNVSDFYEKIKFILTINEHWLYFAFLEKLVSQPNGVEGKGSCCQAWSPEFNS